MKGMKIFLAMALIAAIGFVSSEFYKIAKADSKRGASKPQVIKTKTSVAKRNLDPARLENGKMYFAEFCSLCHGDDGEGDPSWKTPDEDGKYPAPPLNGTGHAWHHPMKVLHDNIKHGNIDRGGSMMGFEGGMSDKDITDVILFFQSKWPDELYESWYRRDQKSKM